VPICYFVMFHAKFVNAHISKRERSEQNSMQIVYICSTRRSGFTNETITETPRKAVLSVFTLTSLLRPEVHFVGKQFGTSQKIMYRNRFSDWLRVGRPRGRSSSPDTVKNFLFSMSSRPALRSTQPPNQWVAGALSPAVKLQGREADHSPPLSAKAKNT
jgi:hypothetical protein